MLRAISDGCHDWGEIIGRVKDFKDGAQLAPYIKKLEGLRLIEVTRSLDASEKDRNRRYDLSDPFLEFWFRFVLPNRSALEVGHAKDVLEALILPFMEDHMGGAFERICREFVRLHGQEVLGIAAREVGRVWAADYDLDVAGELLDGSSLYGECKWWKDPVGENVLERLLETSGARQVRNPRREHAVPAVLEVGVHPGAQGAGEARTEPALGRVDTPAGTASQESGEQAKRADRA